MFLEYFQEEEDGMASAIGSHRHEMRLADDMDHRQFQQKPGCVKPDALRPLIDKHLIPINAPLLTIGGVVQENNGKTAKLVTSLLCTRINLFSTNRDEMAGTSLVYSPDDYPQPPKPKDIRLDFEYFIELSKKGNICRLVIVPKSKLIQEGKSRKVASAPSFIIKRMPDKSIAIFFEPNVVYQAKVRTLDNNRALISQVTNQEHLKSKLPPELAPLMLSLRIRKPLHHGEGPIKVFYSPWMHANLEDARKQPEKSITTADIVSVMTDITRVVLNLHDQGHTVGLTLANALMTLDKDGKVRGVLGGIKDPGARDDLFQLAFCIIKGLLPTFNCPDVIIPKEIYDKGCAINAHLYFLTAQHPECDYSDFESDYENIQALIADTPNLSSKKFRKIMTKDLQVIHAACELYYDALRMKDKQIDPKAFKEMILPALGKMQKIL